MFTMKEYVSVNSLQQAYELNQKKSNRIIGGMVWMKMYHNDINVGIDLSNLNLNTIIENDYEFSIGCMCTLRELETNESINQYFNNVMKETVRHIVGVQLRNSATIGGSIFSQVLP